MSEPDNLILAHLRELRADMNTRFDKADQRFAAIEASTSSTPPRSRSCAISSVSGP